jgi:hypothetical protein
MIAFLGTVLLCCIRSVRTKTLAAVRASGSIAWSKCVNKRGDKDRALASSATLHDIPSSPRLDRNGEEPGDSSTLPMVANVFASPLSIPRRQSIHAHRPESVLADEDERSSPRDGVRQRLDFHEAPATRASVVSTTQYDFEHAGFVRLPPLPPRLHPVDGTVGVGAGVEIQDAAPISADPSTKPTKCLVSFTEPVAGFVVYEYAAVHPGDVSLNPGEPVLVTAQWSDGWWEVSHPRDGHGEDGLLTRAQNRQNRALFEESAASFLQHTSSSSAGVTRVPSDRASCISTTTTMTMEANGAFTCGGHLFRHILTATNVGSLGHKRAQEVATGDWQWRRLARFN